jgi:preprotein translocase subunit SecF
VELFPHNSKINFMQWRMPALVAAALMLVAALVALPTRGLNFALDFTGGALIEMKFEKPTDLQVLRQQLADAKFENAIVQNIGSDTSDVVIRLRVEEGKMSTEMLGTSVLSTLQSSENPAQIVRSDFVGPQVGKELAQQGILAVLFVGIGFLAYVTLRFEVKFAIAAIITTMHDVVVTVGIFAITQWDFDLNVLAGVLSIMGYSINDTIVVFDRVRENFRTMHNITPYDLLNRSVNQTLSRTIITSFVAFLTVLALYMFGGKPLEGMAMSQMIGIVIGTISSILIACPLLLWMGVTRTDLLPRARDDSDLERRP